MTSTAHPAPMDTRETSMHAFAWVGAIVGLLAAAIGGWMIIAPEDGTITISWNTWSASDLADSWGPGLLITGGAVALVAMTFLAVRDRQRRTNSWVLAGEVVLAAVGLVAMAIGIAALV